MQLRVRSDRVRSPSDPSGTYVRVKVYLGVPPIKGHHCHVEKGDVRPEALANLHVSGRSPLE